MGSTSRKIYRAEIFLNRGQPSNNGGDSVGECLHPGLVNCQLDISKNISILRGFLRPIMRCGESESSKFGGCMLTRVFPFLRGAATVGAVFCVFLSADGQTQTRKPPPLVRIAELEIDPSQLIEYKHALSDEIATSVREEPGVLLLYAVSVKDHPSQVRIFETYKDQAAYESHLQSPHFKKYKDTTHGMVKSLKLIETDPIILAGK
jgi:quinol monooxygenase YgiN